MAIGVPLSLASKRSATEPPTMELLTDEEHPCYGMSDFSERERHLTTSRASRAPV